MSQCPFTDDEVERRMEERLYCEEMYWDAYDDGDYAAAIGWASRTPGNDLPNE